MSKSCILAGTQIVLKTGQTVRIDELDPKIQATPTHPIWTSAGWIEFQFLSSKNIATVRS